MRHLIQWVNWRLVQDPGEAKPRKIPAFSIHDRARWQSYEGARAIDPEHIGFVLTAEDPYFCIDLDACWDGAAWSPLALAICDMFPSAYREVSYSGNGLHIIGQGVPPDGFGTRGPGVEFYTHDRYIAITGNGAQGDPDVLCDLGNFCLGYLKPRGAGTDLVGWRTEPVPEYSNIPDDDDVIKKMLGARHSAAVAFGGKASPRDLWENNVPALADAWPHATDEYDRSSADAALAAHLAYYTGKNHERIRKLMYRSALVRPKWDIKKHSTYLVNTIIGAAERISGVYNVPQVPAGAAGWQFKDIEAQIEHFRGCAYVIGAHKVFVPDGDLLRPDQFKATYGHHDFQMTYDNKKPTKNAFEAFTESQVIKFPKVHNVCFRPDLPTGAIVNEEGRSLVNTYVPIPIKVGDGDVTRFLDLMQRLLPNGDDALILTCYMAALRQYPGVKFQWAPLIQGVEGNGKSALTSICEYAVGHRYSHKPSAKELGDSGAKFTGWLINKMLIIVEEIYISDRREVIDTLKPLITDRRIEIQSKGADQYTARNVANFILTSNHKDAIIKTANDRRYGIFYTAQQQARDLERDGMAGRYLNQFYGWLDNGGYADVTGYLQRLAIPDRFNPATECHRAPATTSTIEAISESQGFIEQEISEAIAEGRPGFTGGWVSSVALASLLRDIRRTVAPRKRRALMESLGYKVLGQVNTPIFQEGGKRPTLYGLEGRTLDLGAYMAAQDWSIVTSRPDIPKE